MKQSPQKVIAGIIGWAIIIAFAWLWLGGSENSDSGTRASSNSPQFNYISQANVVGCTDWDVQDKLTQLAVDQDLEAFEKVLYPALSRGVCRRMKTGEQVFIVENGFTSVKVRPKGGTRAYWVARGDVR